MLSLSCPSVWDGGCVTKEDSVVGLSFLDPARRKKDVMAAQGRSKEEKESFWGFISSSA